MPMFTLVRGTMQGENEVNHERQEFRMLALFLTFIHGPARLYANKDRTLKVDPDMEDDAPARK